MKNSALKIDSVSLAYGGRKIFEDFCLEISESEFVAVVGASGCGKTTLLNLLSGFLSPDKGDVVKSGPSRMVYQHDGLLPWLTVEENISMGAGKEEVEEAGSIRKLVEMVGLESSMELYPYQLSGGMRQKTEIARALLGEAPILLLDEPFGSLDYLTRLRLRREFIGLLEKFRRTVVLVTHDVEEAVEMADRVLVLGDSPARVTGQFRIDRKQRAEKGVAYSAPILQRVLGEMGLEINFGEGLAKAA